MAERGLIRLKIGRSPSVSEFARFLNDLERAYLALYFLPTERRAREERWELPASITLFQYDLSTAGLNTWRDMAEFPVYPEDRLELARIRIESPGWAEVVGALNPLQQIREYLKDRHERAKDHAWRGDAEKEKALLENDILRAQAESARMGAIKEFYDLLGHAGVQPEERQRLLWQRFGLPLQRLGHHQDTGLLGPPDDQESTDG